MSVTMIDGQPAIAHRQMREAVLAVVGVRDHLDIENSDAFLERAQRLAQSSGCLIVDLSRASYVDSCGVRALLFMAEELERDGKELRLVVSPGSRADRTLRLLRLIERLAAYPTLAQARSRTAAATCDGR